MSSGREEANKREAEHGEVGWRRSTVTRDTGWDECVPSDSWHAHANGMSHFLNEGTRFSAEELTELSSVLMRDEAHLTF